MTGEHTEREIEYCGGEMDGWSDPVPADDPRVRYVSELLPEGPGSALLVGARAAKLANHLLRQGFSVTLLVRGESDARSASGSGADVVCGSFEAWTPPVGFDLVIALDSVDDILPPLSDGVGALEFIDVLRRLGSSYVAYLDNGASPASLDRQARAPQENHQFSAFGTGYDLRSPVFAELPEQASAAVFDRAVVGSVAIDRAEARTLLRSLCSDDLRFDALLATPMLAANGWLVGTLGGGDAVAYRGLGGVVATGLPGADGTPVEFRIRQLLVRDLQRVSAGLRAYARWADGRPAPLLRNVIAGRSGFEVIDPTVEDADLPTAMVDLAGVLVHRPGVHPFGPERTRNEIAVELLRLAADTSDPEAEIQSAASAYQTMAFARRVPETDSATTTLIEEVRRKDAQLAALKSDLAKDRRHLRALEHALATESGPRAKRAYFVMTAPTKRLLEAVRRRQIG